MVVLLLVDDGGRVGLNLTKIHTHHFGGGAVCDGLLDGEPEDEFPARNLDGGFAYLVSLEPLASG